jgi:putative ABC transport system substrate-binding protein
MVGLVAWAQRLDPVPLQVLILDSLAHATATDALPAFQAELRTELGSIGHTVAFHRVPLASAADRRLPELPHADLVVSFGALATEHASHSLRGSTIPHLFAFVPRRLAADVTTLARNAGGSTPTGITDHLQSSSAVAIASRLLETRPGPPLRIGFLYPVGSEGPARFAPPSADARQLGRFVDVPFAWSEDTSAGTVLESVVSGAAAAVADEPLIDCFWISVDLAVRFDILVHAIEERTGRPVLFAPTQAAVAAGALMAMAPEPVTTARDAAMMATKLLDGTAPAMLPTRSPRRIEFALNLTTAETLDIVPPHELLELARGRLFR